MKDFMRKVGFWTLAFTFTGSAAGFAEGPVDVAKLQAQVEALTQQVVTLQQQVEVMKGEKATVPAYVVPANGETKEGGLLRTIEDIRMGGYIDTQYTDNLQSETTNLGGNPIRIFDNDSDTFKLNAAKVFFEKQANPEGGAGFRLDMLMGEDAEVVDFDPTTDQDEFSIEQAYVELVAPLKFFEDSNILPHTVKVIGGRFVTMAGAEVIEAPYNWNISRSMMFGYAIPFTHTGIRSSFGLFDNFLNMTLGVNNGWDNVVDNNQFKTVETAVSFSPIERVKLTSAAHFGPENASQDGHKRYLLTNVITWDATDRLQFMADIDFGTERRVPGLEGRDFENAQWHGYAGYARYKLTEKLALAYRFEFFNDNDLFRTAGLDNSLWGQTLTAEYQMYKNLIGRVEFRMDKADGNNIFNGESNQQTLGAQLIYLFA